MTPLLSIENARVSYRSVAALNEFSLEVQPNEVFALLGPSGAGKTTTLMAVAGLLPLDKGRILLEDRDVTHTRPASRDIAMVFEGLNLLPTLDVKGNIGFPLRSPSYREDESEIEVRTSQVASLLKISKLLDRDVETLSGGEKQRVAIARALVRSPCLFLLDEPLSALDLKLREELQAELRSIHKRSESTILYATHDFHGAVAVADRIGVIENGVLHQTGRLKELIQNPNDMTVGRLIGSPAMAFFDAYIENDTVCLENTEMKIPVASFGRVAGENRLVTLGFWPNDIELSANNGMGNIYAVDNRGFENAVQVQTPAGNFRKVVPETMKFAQGDNCDFHLPANSGFLFCKRTGDRISNQEMA